MEASRMVVRLLFIGSFLVTCSPVISLSCVPCSWVRCSTPVNCKGGLVKSICGCCNVCAKVAGERCGGLWPIQEHCDSGLKCVVRDGHLDGHLKTAEGTCEPGTFCFLRNLNNVVNNYSPTNIAVYQNLDGPIQKMLSNNYNQNFRAHKIGEKTSKMKLKRHLDTKRTR